jgi:hypothetical protein
VTLVNSSFVDGFFFLLSNHFIGITKNCFQTLKGKPCASTMDRISPLMIILGQLWRPQKDLFTKLLSNLHSQVEQLSLSKHKKCFGYWIDVHYIIARSL